MWREPSFYTSVFDTRIEKLVDYHTLFQAFCTFKHETLVTVSSDRAVSQGTTRVPVRQSGKRATKKILTVFLTGSPGAGNETKASTTIIIEGVQIKMNNFLRSFDTLKPAAV